MDEQHMEAVNNMKNRSYHIMELLENQRRYLIGSCCSMGLEVLQEFGNVVC